MSLGKFVLVDRFFSVKVLYFGKLFADVAIMTTTTTALPK
jgi:hypothetical protein